MVGDWIPKLVFTDWAINQTYKQWLPASKKLVHIGFVHIRVYILWNELSESLKEILNIPPGQVLLFLQMIAFLPLFLIYADSKLISFCFFCQVIISSLERKFWNMTYWMENEGFQFDRIIVIVLYQAYAHKTWYVVD